MSSVSGSSLPVAPPVEMLDRGVSPRDYCDLYARYLSVFGKGGGVSAEFAESRVSVPEWRSRVSPSSAASSVFSKELAYEPEARVSAMMAGKREVVESYGSGYCYLYAVEAGAVEQVARDVGPNPLFSRLVACESGLFESNAMLGSLRVAVEHGCAHISGANEGVTTFLTLLRSLKRVFPPGVLGGRAAGLSACSAPFVDDEGFRIGVGYVPVVLKECFSCEVGPGVHKVGYVSERSVGSTMLSFEFPQSVFWIPGSSVDELLVDGVDVTSSPLVHLLPGQVVKLTVKVRLASFWTAVYSVDDGLSLSEGMTLVMQHAQLQPTPLLVMGDDAMMLPRAQPLPALRPVMKDVSGVLPGFSAGVCDLHGGVGKVEFPSGKFWVVPDDVVQVQGASVQAFPGYFVVPGGLQVEMQVSHGGLLRVYASESFPRAHYVSGSKIDVGGKVFAVEGGGLNHGNAPVALFASAFHGLSVFSVYPVVCGGGEVVAARKVERGFQVHDPFFEGASRVSGVELLASGGEWFRFSHVAVVMVPSGESYHTRIGEGEGPVAVLLDKGTAMRTTAKFVYVTTDITV